MMIWQRKAGEPISPGNVALTRRFSVKSQVSSYSVQHPSFFLQHNGLYGRKRSDKKGNLSDRVTNKYHSYVIKKKKK